MIVSSTHYAKKVTHMDKIMNKYLSLHQEEDRNYNDINNSSYILIKFHLYYNSITQDK